MKRVLAALVAVLTFGGWALMAPAHAVPPTVTPSPGYDARLREQRTAPTVYEPAAPVVPARKPHRHGKRSY